MTEIKISPVNITISPALTRTERHDLIERRKRDWHLLNIQRQVVQLTIEAEIVAHTVASEHSMLPAGNIMDALQPRLLNAVKFWWMMAENEMLDDCAAALIKPLKKGDFWVRTSLDGVKEYGEFKLVVSPKIEEILAW